MPMATREAQREYQNSWVQARRAKWLSENGPCVLCGSDLDLQVDHIDPATKEIHVATLWGMSEKNPKRVAELAKCRVLCAECHLVKSKTEKLKGCAVPCAKLTPEQVHQIRGSTESWYRIGHLFPVSKCQFYKVRRGETYKLV